MADVPMTTRSSVENPVLSVLHTNSTEPTSHTYDDHTWHCTAATEAAVDDGATD